MTRTYTTKKKYKTNILNLSVKTKTKKQITQINTITL